MLIKCSLDREPYCRPLIWYKGAVNPAHNPHTRLPEKPCIVHVRNTDNTGIMKDALMTVAGANVGKSEFYSV